MGALLSDPNIGALVSLGLVGVVVAVVMGLLRVVVEILGTASVNDLSLTLDKPKEGFEKLLLPLTFSFSFVEIGMVVAGVETLSGEALDDPNASLVDVGLYVNEDVVVVLASAPKMDDDDVWVGEVIEVILVGE